MRSRRFKGEAHNRYWWFQLRDTDYVPLVLSSLREEEWALLDSWYEDTGKKFDMPGEIAIPAISLLAGLINGNGVSAVVQCGHYLGFSTLILGFILRSMGKECCLFSVDIDQAATSYTQEWISRAGLEAQVRLHVSTSSDPGLPRLAEAFFGRKPQLVLIDSSHQYAHTKQELDVWYPSLQKGGMLVLHDVSVFGQGFDPTEKGGVLRAALEWASFNRTNCFMLNSYVDGSQSPEDLVYRDGCGIGLIQR